MGSATRPAISVIIPAFNAAGTLDAQLSALARQNLGEPWEVIVADNGSTDDTAGVASAWSQRLPLRVVDAGARRGPAAARNLGVAAASAPLLAFCDADDVVSDDWLARTLAAVRADGFVAIGVRTRAAYSSRREPEYVLYAAYASIYLPGMIACGAGHMAVRADIFRDAGGFDESLLTAEDHDLCYRIQLAGHPLVPHPEAVVTVNRRDRLIDVFRQQYTWGTNDRALRHKYAAVRDVLSDALAHGWINAPDPRDTAVVPLDPPPSRSARLRDAVRSPRVLLTLARRRWSRTALRGVEAAGFTLGRRAGSAAAQLDGLDASVGEIYVRRHRPDAGQRAAQDDSARPDAP